MNEILQSSPAQSIDIDQTNKHLDIDEVQDAFTEFTDSIDTRLQQMNVLQDKTTHPDFIAGGGVFDVIGLEKDGKEYVARIPWDSSHPEIIRKQAHRVEALLQASGHPRLEQITAASLENGIIVSERVRGIPGEQITAETISELTDEALAITLDDLSDVQQLGLHIDNNAGNFIVTDHGIVLIDVGLSLPMYPQGLEKKIEIFAEFIDHGGIVNEIPIVAEDFVRLAHEKQVRTTTLERLKAIYTAKNPGDSRVVQRIDNLVEQNLTIIANYSNPQWVHDRVAHGDAVTHYLQDIGMDVV